MVRVVVVFVSCCFGDEGWTGKAASQQQQHEGQQAQGKGDLCWYWWMSGGKNSDVSFAAQQQQQEGQQAQGRYSVVVLWWC